MGNSGGTFGESLFLLGTVVGNFSGLFFCLFGYLRETFGVLIGEFRGTLGTFGVLLSLQYSGNLILRQKTSAKFVCGNPTISNLSVVM